MLAHMPTASCDVVESPPHLSEGLLIDLAADALKHEDLILCGVKQKSFDDVLCFVVAWMKGDESRSLHFTLTPRSPPLPLDRTKEK